MWYVFYRTIFVNSNNGILIMKKFKHDYVSDEKIGIKSMQLSVDTHKKIKKLAHSVSEGMGGSCEVKILKGYPYLQNHPQLTQRTRKGAEEYMGKENVVDLDLWMAAEDFAFYTLKLDACFYRLGVRNEEKGIISNVHTSTFDIDENALEIGPGLMAWLALNELNN